MRYLLFLISFITISYVSFSQETEDLSAFPGRWIYTNDNLSNEWYAESYYNMNESELLKFHSATDKLVNYLHQQPIAQKPLGVTLDVKSRVTYNHYDHEQFPVKPDETVKAEIFISFCNLIQRNGKLESACEEVSYIDVITNDASQVFEPAMSYDQLDDKQAVEQYKVLFYLPAKLLDLGSGVYLYDWYYKNRIVIARTDRSYWLPVTNKEYINRTMIYYNASLKEGKIPQMVIDALIEEIATVTPEMMDLPAFVNQNARRPLTGICSKDEESAFALYKFNPGYFDNSLPRTQVQLITIAIEGQDDSPEWGEINAHRVWEFIQGLKGADLKNLLNVN
jgi:hypothetical protein